MQGIPQYMYMAVVRATHMATTMAALSLIRHHTHSHTLKRGTIYSDELFFDNAVSESN